MNSELQQAEYSNATVKEGIKALENSEPESIAMLPPATHTEEQWQRFSRQVSNFLAQLPEYLSRFYNEYKLPIISFALLIVAITALKILLAVLDTINDIPLVSPLLELIGIGYTTWFTFRYLLKASTRQELAAELDSIRKQIAGGITETHS